MESKIGGMEVSEAKRLKTLENENTKLKRLLVDAMLDNAASTNFSFVSVVMCWLRGSLPPI